MPDFDPTAALADPVLQRFLLLAGGVIATASLVIGALKLAGKNVAHPWSSLKSWLVLATLLFGALILGRTASIVFFTLVALVAFKEFARATGLHKDFLYSTAVNLGVLAIGVLAWVVHPRRGDPGWYGLFMALPVYVIALIVLIPTLRNRAKGQLQRIALSVVGFVYIGWMFGHLTFLLNARNAFGYVLFLVFAVEINDVAAYTFGRTFGKHPLRSEVSPNKTWEGSLGALAVSMALPWAMRFALPEFGTVELILTGLIVGIGGQLGDLGMSVIKRDLGVKDMGASIPGHGGVLDRIDSLIYTAPLFFHLARVEPRSLSAAHPDRIMRPWQYETAPDLEQSLVERLEGFPREPEMMVYAVRSVAALLLRGWLKVFHRFTLHGVENLPLGGSFVLVANHASHLDALCLTAAVPLRLLHRVFPAAAADYFFSSVPRSAFSAVIINALPFDRKVQKRQSLELCRRLLDNPGNILAIFPEGTRSTSGEIAEFKAGVGLLVAGKPHPVVPCYLEGAYRAWPKKAWFPRPYRLRLTLGSPLRFEDLEPGMESAQTIAKQVENAVRDLSQPQESTGSEPTA